MPDTKITALTALTAADPANDVLPIVDVSDTTMAASGTTKKISINNILGASGTATLAAATITGNLTVQTNKLFVNATGAAVGTTSLFADFQVQRSTNARLEIDSSSTGISYQVVDNARTGYLQNVTIASQHLWFNGVTEAMRLNSTGLGVGGVPSGLAPVILCEGIAGTYAKFNSKVGAKTWSAGYRSGTLQYEIQEDGTERFVIANGGNVGIGVTPSAWGGGRKAIQISSPANIVSANLTFEVGSNWWHDGTNYKYTATNPVSLYSASNGLHAWYNAPSGTAGNNITLTQVMTLDGNGNLILQSSATPATLTTNGQLTVNATSNTNLRFSYRGSDGVTRVANITLA